MLELYDAKVSLEDANLKFLRSLPSVWHVVATMIRGQPGLDKLDFDDLYNNLKVYEHELKGVSNSWVILLGSVDLLNTRKTELYGRNERDCGYCKIKLKPWWQRTKPMKIFNLDKEFDAEPVTFAMMALTEVEQDDWSMEFNAEHVHFGQDGLGDFDWSNKADDTPVSLALMATNSEEKLEKWSNAAVLQNEVLNKQRYLSDKSCIGFGVESSSGMDSENSSRNTNSSESSYPNFQKAKGFHSVPPPTGTIIPPRANVSFTGIDELAIRNKVLNQENTKSSQPEIDRNKVIIEDWVDSDDEETVFNSSEIKKKTVSNSENSEISFENRSPSSQNSVGQVSRKTEPSNKPKLINLREHRVQGTQDQFGTTSKGFTIVISQETLGTLTKGGLSFHQQYLQGNG
ncbi:hypothetical protein Tco_1149273 [Tanacetum coccineum]